MISTMPDLKAALPGRSYAFYKSSSQFGVSLPGGTSAWLIGTRPSPAVANPPGGVGEVPTKATLGAFPIVNPGAGKTLYVAKFRAVQTADYAATSADQNIFGDTYVWLLDRLVHNSGLSGTSTGLQTFNSVSVTRPDGTGAGAELFFEGYVQCGATPTTATVNYTNSAGAAKTVVVTFPGFFGPSGSNQQYNLMSIPLVSGDVGVRSVQSVQLAGSTGTTGNFGITIARRICGIRATRDTERISEHFDTGFAQIDSDAALMLALTNGGGNGDHATLAASYGYVSGQLTTVEG